MMDPNPVPPGTILNWAGTYNVPLPDGWMLCNGQHGTPYAPGHIIKTPYHFVLRDPAEPAIPEDRLRRLENKRRAERASLQRMLAEMYKEHRAEEAH